MFVLQVVCDADLVFIDVVAKWPGSVHDARILRRSALFDAFEGPRKPVTGFLLGDSGYMLRDWLLTPIVNPRTQQEETYNFRQSSTRTAVERSIGVAKRRWHCLRRLRLSPTKACQVITVCLMLHNRARKLALPDVESDSDDSDTDPQDSDTDQAAIPAAAAAEGAMPPNERVRTAAGKVARNNLIEAYF